VKKGKLLNSYFSFLFSLRPLAAQRYSQYHSAGIKMAGRRAPVGDRRRNRRRERRADRPRYRAINTSRRVHLPVPEHPTNPIRFTAMRHSIGIGRENVDAALAHGAAAAAAAHEELSPAPAEVPVSLVFLLILLY
jgi:hypothetical protein